MSTFSRPPFSFVDDQRLVQRVVIGTNGLVLFRPLAYVKFLLFGRFAVKDKRPAQVAPNRLVGGSFGWRGLEIGPCQRGLGGPFCLHFCRVAAGLQLHLRRFRLFTSKGQHRRGR